MANLVNLERVGKSYGTTVPLQDVSLGIADGERIGVVGLNGAGKSTLLRMLTAAEEPDTGRVTHRNGLRLGVLDQQQQLPEGATVRDVVLGSAWLDDDLGAEHEWAGDARVRQILTGLGLPKVGLDTVVDPLSGGERRRVALAALLVRELDLLVLDEPTNHLDIEGVAWLARHLVARRGLAVAVVTHDRWFLDSVCEVTWEVVDASVRSYEGGFSAWTLARAERARQERATEARRQNLIRKELAWLRRGPPARTSKPKFRIESANALIADEPKPRDTVELRRFATRRLGKDVYDAEDIRLVTPAGRELLSTTTWRLGPGDRVAVIGANGSGKTTLLRALAGVREPDGGRVRIGATVRAAHLSQEAAELPDRLRVLEAVQEVANRIQVGDREMTASTLAEMFGFGPGRQWTPVADLSGGERRRLHLLRLLMGEPNVLLLDEPTNDLDTDTLAALEDLLDSWPGTMVVISHDRYLLERTCDVVYAFLGDGKLTMLPGGVEEYLRRRAELDAASAASPSAVLTGSPGSGETADSGGTSAVAGSAGAGSANSGSADSGSADSGSAEFGAGGTSAAGAGSAVQTLSSADERAARKEMARLERELTRLAQRQEKVHAQLAENATDHVKVAELDATLRDLAEATERAETRWLELGDLLT